MAVVLLFSLYLCLSMMISLLNFGNDNTNGNISSPLLPVCIGDTWGTIVFPNYTNFIGTMFHYKSETLIEYS